MSLSYHVHLYRLHLYVPLGTQTFTIGLSKYEQNTALEQNRGCTLGHVTLFAQRVTFTCIVLIEQKVCVLVWRLLKDSMVMCLLYFVD